MENWCFLYSFTYPHEAHLVRTKLESEGIEVLISDEETIQVVNIYSEALGGVRMHVREVDYQKARGILSSLDFKMDSENNPTFLAKKINSISKSIPFLKDLRIELRFIIFLFLMITLLVLVIYLSKGFFI